MSISQIDIIDVVSTSPEGNIVLTISDHYTWDDWKGHLFALHEKINSYLQFIESGQVFESYPHAKSQQIVIGVILQFEPPEDAIQALSQFKETIVAAGFDFVWEHLPTNN